LIELVGLHLAAFLAVQPFASLERIKVNLFGELIDLLNLIEDGGVSE